MPLQVVTVVTKLLVSPA